MAAETAPQSDTASEKTDSNKQNMKKEVVLNSAKPETTRETPAKSTAEVSSTEPVAAASTAKATETEHSQVESQPQAKPATTASSSAVVSKP